jgi:hypothetical protein
VSHRSRRLVLVVIGLLALAGMLMCSLGRERNLCIQPHGTAIRMVPQIPIRQD